MANDQNIEPYQYKPGQSGNPLGRPKRIYTILRESGYSPEDIRDAFLEIAWQTEPEIEVLVEKEDTPMILKVVGKAFLKALDKGDMRYVTQILEQVMGKPRERDDEKYNGPQYIVLKEVEVNLNGLPKFAHRESDIEL